MHGNLDKRFKTIDGRLTNLEKANEKQFKTNEAMGALFSIVSRLNEELVEAQEQHAKLETKLVARVDSKIIGAADQIRQSINKDINAKEIVANILASSELVPSAIQALRSENEDKITKTREMTGELFAIQRTNMKKLEKSLTDCVSTQKEQMETMRFHLANPELSKNVPGCFSDYFLMKDQEAATVAQAADMLVKPPERCGKAHLKTWNKVRRNILELFVKTFPIVERNFKLFDGECHLDTWSDQKGRFCIGTRLNRTGKKHGVVRKVTLNDCIEEACYFNGQTHGLTIQYGEKLVLVALYKNGEKEANFSFDHSFKQ